MHILRNILIVENDNNLLLLHAGHSTNLFVCVAW